jgi:hypothetical protein
MQPFFQLIAIINVLNWVPLAWFVLKFMRGLPLKPRTKEKRLEKPNYTNFRFSELKFKDDCLRMIV